MPSHYDELGLKVQRAQYELTRIRGVATVDGVTVEVDAENRLLAVDVSNSAAILAAYQAALADKEPQVVAAMQELSDDPQVQSVQAFAEANTARHEAERLAQEDTRSSSGRFFESSW
ncbi:hypothetical protein [Nocardia altamirensis]|uniref:hypothetical protein n=1 Tax=Nocardia altamirensis TaxID=472158 RepID=UPI00083FF735|nr:hypothetical protein [Nocardia altamirensis]